MSEENKTQKSKLPIMIAIIILVVVIAAVGGYFAYQYIEEQKPIEQEWADTYYNFIKGSDEEEANAEDRKIQNNSKIGFIDVEQVENPVMIVEYQKEEKTYTDLYYINDGQVNNVIDLGIANVELLYDINTKKYDWYTYKETETNDVYKKVSAEILEKNTANADETTDEAKTEEITFTKGEEISVDTVDGNKISIPKFDTVFVKTDVEVGKVDYTEELTNKELKKVIIESANKYKTDEEIVTEDVKKEVTNKESEVATKQEEMKKAEEEVAKKIAEEKARAEEEARKKAEEEAKKGIKAGNYTLKYGAYKCDQDGVGGGTYVIKQDGTFTFSNNWSNIKNEKYKDTGSGSYKVYFSEGDDYDSTKSWIIEFTYSNYHSTYEPSNSYKPDSHVFDVTSNNKFQYRQGVGTFTYQGN